MKKALLVAIMLFSIGAMAQRVGIGTTTPNAKLEVVGEGSTNLTNNLILKNSAGDTLLRLRNDGKMLLGYNGSTIGRTLSIGGQGVNFYRDDVTFSGSIFPTDTSIIMWSQQADNDYVILQPGWGKVGVRTYSPKATFDVAGDFKLGTLGSVLTQIIKVTINRNINAVAAATTSIQTFVVPGADIHGTVYVSPDTPLPDGLVIASARVSAADVVEVRFYNATIATVNPDPMSFHITVIN